MPTDASVKKTSRKGPSRSEESRSAILEATRAELAESGWRTFSVDAVAKRASASKQTIYRWWPSIGAMCVDAALALESAGDQDSGALGGTSPAGAFAHAIEQGLLVTCAKCYVWGLVAKKT